MGMVITDSQGVVLQLANCSLPRMTNIEAEYNSLIFGLQTAAQSGIAHLEFCLDSEVVVHQMTGRFAVNSPRLKPLHGQACALTRAFAQIQFRHIPRDLNALADALAAEAAAGRSWCSPQE